MNKMTYGMPLETIVSKQILQKFTKYTKENNTTNH